MDCVSGVVQKIWWVQYLRFDFELFVDVEIIGDTVYLNILGSKMIILGSMKSVTDLLEKRSSIYSSRHQTVMLNEL